MRKIPPADYRPEYLDRQVIFDVELPDGAAHGPVIDRLELARLRLVSGPKFRAYVAAHSVAWRPGVTRRRHPRNQSSTYGAPTQRTYPVLTAADRRRLAFGSQDKKNRTRANQDAAWEGPSWGQDPYPDGNYPGWSARLADRPRGGGGGHPRTCATGESDLRNRRI